MWHCFSTTNCWGKVSRCPAALVTGPISAQGDATHHIDTPGRLSTHHSVARGSQYTDLCQLTVSLNLQVASSEQAMESRRFPLTTNLLQWRTEFHSAVQMNRIHCMEQSLYIRCAVVNSSVWLVLRRHASTMTWLISSIKKKEREILNIFSKNYYTVLHTICILRPLKAECFCHTSPSEARAPCLKERQGDVYSQQSQTPSHSSKACGRNVLFFFFKKCERGKEDYSERHGWGRAGSLPHYPLETTQCWYYQLQTCFRIKQPIILGCRTMSSGNRFQTFRRNAPPHIQDYMSVNSLTYFSHKPQATDKCKRMGAREIDVST
jgi:hypothetical protein